jgi:hypothetical protein
VISEWRKVRRERAEARQARGSHEWGFPRTLQTTSEYRDARGSKHLTYRRGISRVLNAWIAVRIPGRVRNPTTTNGTPRRTARNSVSATLDA